MPTDLMDTLGMGLYALFLILGTFFVAFHIALTIWTFRDICSRSRSILTQLLATLLILITNLPGLLLYLILRPPETLSEQYERALEEEALLQDIEERQVCPGCKRKTEPDFIVCPSCHTRLKKKCSHCGRLLHLRWNICPYCSESQAGAMSQQPFPQEMAEEPDLEMLELS